MPFSIKPFITTVTLASMSLPVAAHHGVDFFDVQTAHVPHSGEIYGVLRQDYVKQEEGEGAEFGPGLVVGIRDWVAAELHGHGTKSAGENAVYEGVAPALHFRFTPRQNPLALGLSMEYEFADEAEEAEHGEEHEAEHHHGDVFETAAVVAYEADNWMLAVNALYEDESGGDSGVFGFALGARADMVSGHALGVELLGEESEGATQITFGYFGELAHHLTLNLGAGSGIQSDLDSVVKTSLIWHFH